MEVNFSCMGIESNVLEYSSKSNCIKNLWLFLARKPNSFGIASSLHVENSPISPYVLVVSDQLSISYSTQSSFSCSRKSKE